MHSVNIRLEDSWSHILLVGNNVRHKLSQDDELRGKNSTSDPRVTMKLLRQILHWIFGIGLIATVVTGIAALVRQSYGLEAEPEIGRRLGTILFELLGFYFTRRA
jgi:hypothetical protein